MTRYEIRPGTFAPCELFAVDEIETAMKGR